MRREVKVIAIHPLGIEDVVEGMDVMNIQAVNSYIVQAEDIQIGSAIDETIFALTYSGKWKGSNVVVKVPKIDRDVTETELIAIKSEINAIRKITDSLVIPVFCACITSPDICIVGPLQESGSLQSILFNSEIELSATESIKIAYQVAQGLQYLHGLKMPHGALKPSNVLVY